MSQDYPESISIILLTEGYIVQFRGAQFAAGTIQQVQKIVRESLRAFKNTPRSGAPPLDVPRTTAPTYTTPSSPSPTTQTPPAPAATPDASTSTPDTMSTPSPGGSQGGGTPSLAPDLAISRTNLWRLARGRVMGEMTDQEYFTCAQEYAPGLEDSEIYETLDSAFEQATGEVIDVPPPVPVSAQGSDSPPRGVPKGMTIVEDISPRDFVQDWISDEYGNPIGGM